MGAPSEVLTPSETKEICPGLRVDDLAFGLLGPDDGEIRADQILSAYARAASSLGADLCFEERAVGLRVCGGRVCAVVTTQREIACEVVINAAGADAAEVGSWAGVNIPLKNRRRSLFFGTTTASEFASGPMVEDAALEWYYRPLGDNRILVGMGLEPEAPPTDGPNMAFLPQVRDAARHRAPLLADFTVTGGSSGIRPLTSDILPIVGPVQETQGFVLSCGWGGEGIMHSPAGGALVADWVNGTQTCPIERGQFLLDRFSVTTKEKTS